MFKVGTRSVGLKVGWRISVLTSKAVPQTSWWASEKVRREGEDVLRIKKMVTGGGVQHRSEDQRDEAWDESGWGFIAALSCPRAR